MKNFGMLILGKDTRRIRDFFFHGPALRHWGLSHHLQAVTGKAEDRPSAWAATTYLGELDGVLGSWLRPGPVCLCGHWRSGKIMEDVFLALHL